MNSDERIERSRRLYERALFNDDDSALAVAERELDSVEADLSLARGRLIHGRFLERPNEDQEDPRELALFERARQLYQALGDVRGEAEALFWIGCCHQVVRKDNDAAVPALERSLDLAHDAMSATGLGGRLRLVEQSQGVVRSALAGRDIDQPDHVRGDAGQEADLPAQGR